VAQYFIDDTNGNTSRPLLGRVPFPHSLRFKSVGPRLRLLIPFPTISWSRFLHRIFLILVCRESDRFFRRPRARTHGGRSRAEICWPLYLRPPPHVVGPSPSHWLPRPFDLTAQRSQKVWRSQTRGAVGPPSAVCLSLGPPEVGPFACLADPGPGQQHGGGRPKGLGELMLEQRVSARPSIRRNPLFWGWGGRGGGAKQPSVPAGFCPNHLSIHPLPLLPHHGKM